ncbi:putative endonuclease [Peptoniphilus olsenii]|uniref:Endonuclease n=1 Tax=Peptoniphilus olsenii TaxID=411570 RepID=A0ABV2J9M6_9FIRM
MKNEYVYILKCSDGTLYTGYTNNLKRRLIAHNNGNGAKYTCGRLPVKYVFTQKCSDKSDALKKEIFIKGLSKTNKVKLINGKIDLDKSFQAYTRKKDSK